MGYGNGAEGANFMTARQSGGDFGATMTPPSQAAPLGGLVGC